MTERWFDSISRPDEDWSEDDDFVDLQCVDDDDDDDDEEEEEEEEDAVADDDDDDDDDEFEDDVVGCDGEESDE